uniref:Hydrogenase maturase HydF n=1 Tax=Paratrimastix pyriformis TaxID=342808 RepID=M4QSK6_9EUKA|nr:hydrogenase maturase HydF [Paratrimastix pyriformis]
MLSRSLLLRGSLLDSLQYMPFSAAASTTVQKPLPFFSKLFGLRTPHAAPSDLSLEPARAAGPGSELQLRTNIGIFGRMNAGKSTLINAITQQNTSIVDAHAGTTADVKTALMEFHAMGPVKLFDTAGADEQGGLGSKKLAKTLSALKESDLVIVVVDAFTPGVRSDLKVERELVRHAMELGKSVLVLFNGPAAAHTTPAATSELIRDLTAPFRTQFPQYFQTQTPPSPSSPSSAPSPSSSSPRAAASRPAAGPRILSITTDLHQPGTGARLVQLIEANFPARQAPGSVLPALPRDSTVFLNIPLDEESPTTRLLRPQALVLTHLLNSYANAFAYRMDLTKARSPDPAVRATEKARFLDKIHALQRCRPNGLGLLVTDSQAIDVVHPWTLGPTGEPLVPVTTFSIALINHQTEGRLAQFIEGLRALETLRPGDRVLVAEACNHNRIAAVCNDIGTVQLPKKFAQRYGPGAIQIDHEFGREFPIERLAQYRLVVHCGACMIDRQKMIARLDDLKRAGVPVTNYGVLLSYLASPKALARAVEPFGIRVPAS